MDLVNKKQRRAAGVLQSIGGAAEDAPHLGDITLHSTETLELTFGSIGNDLRQRGFTGAGRAVENQRLNAVSFNGAQRHAGFENVLLASIFLKSARAHAGGEGCLSLTA